MWPFCKKQDESLKKHFEILQVQNQFYFKRHEELLQEKKLLTIDINILIEHLLVYNKYVMSHSSMVDNFVQAVQSLPDNMGQTEEIIKKYRENSKSE